MRLTGSWLLLTAMIILVISEMTSAGPYGDDDDVYEDDYTDNSLDRVFQNAQKFHRGNSFSGVLPSKRNDDDERACIRRGGNCDHRPNDCCYNSSCRCNLWGSNCRCQRMGLFQKWG